MKLRAKMLYEYAMIVKALSFTEDNEDNEMEYLFVIKAVGDGQEDDEDWAGKMNETKRAIIAVEANLKKEINANTASNNSKMDTINASTNSNIATINSKMDTINASINAINEKFDIIMKINFNYQL